MYASVCRAFVVCAPPTVHVDSHAPCDVETYMRRGWCRLEQWARLATGGLENMYVFAGEELTPLAERPDWYTEACKVFEGDFTCASDKPLLVTNVLGLWGFALCGGTAHAASAQLQQTIVDHKDDIFPPAFFGDLVAVLETQIMRELGAEDAEGAALLLDKETRGRFRRLNAVHDRHSSFEATASEARLLEDQSLTESTPIETMHGPITVPVSARVYVQS